MKRFLVIESDLERELEALVDEFKIEERSIALATICAKKASEPEVDWERWAKIIKEFTETAIRREIKIIVQPEK